MDKPITTDHINALRDIVDNYTLYSEKTGKKVKEVFLTLNRTRLIVFYENYYEVYTMSYEDFAENHCTHESVCALLGELY